MGSGAREGGPETRRLTTKYHRELLTLALKDHGDTFPSRDHLEAFPLDHSTESDTPVEGDFGQFWEATRILDAAQFSRRDVLDLTGLSEAQLKNTLDRGLVRLASDHNPGTGRRRMFTGADVLKLAVAHTMSAIGFPMRWSYLIADQVATRASNRLISLTVDTHLKFALYPNTSGEDWSFTPMSDERPTPSLPAAYQILDVDTLIDETMLKLRAVVADEPIPDVGFKPPPPEPSPYSPENDFFRMWATDQQGRTIRVGLTFEETEELTRLEEDDSRDRTEGRRYLELHEKHELARLQRIGVEMAEKARP
ncbi:MULTISPECIES: hypothetical protein [unclassified Brevundimonas]|uniref:hypothetical protein n=1 Tax=unclassified Brevundimonas TaxID=2622653 RepID=UPI0025BCF419|nr:MULTISPECIES: hypothetical protein [unclassified Brevundimonas]